MGLADARSNLGVKIDRRRSVHDRRGRQGRRVAAGAPRLRLRAHARRGFATSSRTTGYDEQFVKYWTNLPFLINPDTRLAVSRRGGLARLRESRPPTRTASTIRRPTCASTRAPTAVQPVPLHVAREQPGRSGPVHARLTVNGDQAKTAGQIYWEEAEPWTLGCGRRDLLAGGRTASKRRIELYVERRLRRHLRRRVLRSPGDAPPRRRLACCSPSMRCSAASRRRSPRIQNHGPASLTADRPTSRLGAVLLPASSAMAWAGQGRSYQGRERSPAGCRSVAELGRQGPRRRGDAVATSSSRRCDTMGANEHKGIHQWQTCAPKELRQAITTRRALSSARHVRDVRQQVRRYGALPSNGRRPTTSRTSSSSSIPT